MKCEKCGLNDATTHLKQIVNGNMKELHLCEECAAELGYDSIFNINPFGMMGVNIGSFLGSLFSQSVPGLNEAAGKRCSFCGATFDEIAQSAKTGCANCYTEFYDELFPSIQRIHGKTRHVGKIPGRAGEELQLRRELDTLKKQLNEAVEAQEYEKAAELRDKIKEMEKKVQG